MRLGWTYSYISGNETFLCNRYYSKLVLDNYAATLYTSNMKIQLPLGPVPNTNWKVLDTAPSIREGNAVRSAYLCECMCGTKSIVSGFALTHGRSKQCKTCSARSAGGAAGRVLFKHGHSPFGRKPSRTYSSWYAMKARCSNPNNKRYDDYAGRGITFCDRWESFQNFLEDMGERPEGTSLDRINVNGNYEPTNCRWADAQTQANNKRKLRVLDKYADEEICLEFIRRGLKIEP